MMKKTTFSLVELLLTLALITTCLGSLSFSISTLIKTNLFEQEAKRLALQLELANDLVLEKNVDIDVKLSQRKGHLVCELHSDHPSLLSEKEKKVSYKHLDRAKIGEESGDNKIKISFFGSKSPPLKIVLMGPRKKQITYTIESFPHVMQR